MPKIWLLKTEASLHHFGKPISLFEYIKLKKHMKELLQKLTNKQ